MFHPYFYWARWSLGVKPANVKGGALFRGMGETLHLGNSSGVSLNHLLELLALQIILKSQLIFCRKYFDTPAKYFAVDAGLRNARLNFREPERTYLMENVVYNELRRRGYSVDVGVVDIQSTVDGKRVFKRHEIDFVVNLPLGKMYIQSAFNIDDPVRKAAETASLHKTGDFFRKLIVTDGNRKLVTDEAGISYVGVLQFLTNLDIMN